MTILTAAGLLAKGSVGGSTPATIFGADLVAWFKRGVGIFDALVGGSLVTTNGQEIGRWEDQSGNAYHLVREFATSFGHLQWDTSKTWQGVGSVHLSGGGGAGQFLVPGGIGTALNAAGQAEIWIVTNNNSLGGGLWDMSNSGSEGWYPYSDGNIYEGWGSTVRYSCGAPVVSIQTNAFRRYNVHSSPTATNCWRNFIDANLQHAENTNTVTFRTTGARLGVNAGGGGYDGYVSEIVIAKVVASSGQRADMDTYLTTP